MVVHSITCLTAIVDIWLNVEGGRERGNKNQAVFDFSPQLVGIDHDLPGRRVAWGGWGMGYGAYIRGSAPLLSWQECSLKAPCTFTGFGRKRNLALEAYSPVSWWTDGKWGWGREQYRVGGRVSRQNSSLEACRQKKWSEGMVARSPRLVLA